MEDVSLNTLRKANLARLPQFKNKHGAPAHTEPDGSDWSVAQWLQAFFGEVGEFALVRQSFERGDITHSEYRAMAVKELADIQTYLSLLAARALDVLTHEPDVASGTSAAQDLMGVIASLGSYANERKKFERGDHTSFEEYWEAAEQHLNFAGDLSADLYNDGAQKPRVETANESVANKEGVDLGPATVDKFNEVSRRVGANVFIHQDRVYNTEGRPL